MVGRTCPCSRGRTQARYPVLPGQLFQRCKAMLDYSQAGDLLFTLPLCMLTTESFAVELLRQEGNFKQATLL